MFYDQTEPQLVPIFLLQVSVREMHNSLVSDTNYGVFKDARDEDDNIIISDSTLRSLFPPKLKQIPSQYKVVCGCECCISAKIIHSSFLFWCDRYLKKSRIKSKILKKEGLVKNCITYMKHTKIQSYHMGVIFVPKRLIWQRLSCAHILSLIMHCLY